MAFHKIDFAVPGNTSEDSPFERAIDLFKGKFGYMAIRLPEKNRVQVQFLLNGKVVFPSGSDWVMVQNWKTFIVDPPIEITDVPFQIIARGINAGSVSQVCVVVMADDQENLKTLNQYVDTMRI